jgi:hypothetical protein
LIAAKEKSKEYYGGNSQEFHLHLGDKVLLYDETVWQGRSRKLSAWWVGPYEVLGIDKVNATIKKGRRVQKVICGNNSACKRMSISFQKKSGQIFNPATMANAGPGIGNHHKRIRLLSGKI